jgi:parallel beta-helix repeat protein
LRAASGSPIRFERLGSGAWDRLYVRGAGSTLKFLSVTGGNVGVQLQASNTSLASSFIEGNGTGVSVQDYAGVAPSGVTLTGNTIRSNSTRGVRLWNGAQATLSGNDINSNTNEGVQVDGSTTQATITANTISLNTGAGIRIKTGAEATLTGNTLTGNAIVTSNPGIAVQDAGSFATIGGSAGLGNTVTGNPGSGISLVNGGTATIGFNTLSGNGRYGLYLYNTALAAGQLWQNTIEDNAWSGVFVGATGTLSIEASARNRIADNTQHELNLGDVTARLYASGGYNDLAGTWGTGNYYLYSTAKDNGVDWTVPAETNCWNGGGTPVSGMFFGAVDYSPHAGSCLQAGPVAAGTPERTVRAYLWRLRAAPEAPEAASWLLHLYAALVRERWQMTAGVRSEAGVEAEAWAEAEAVLARYRSGAEGQDLAWEVAQLVAVDHLVREAQWSEALLVAEAALPLVENRDVESGLYVLLSLAQTGLGAWSEALLALEAAEGVAPIAELAEDYTPPDYSPAKAYLEAQLADSATVAPRAEAAPTLASSSARLEVVSELAVAAYPNPFNPATTIRYVLEEAAHVRLVVYDMLGRVVVRLVEEKQAAGVQEAVFDASGLPSGVYLYRIEAGGHVQTGRLVLMK